MPSSRSSRQPQSKSARHDTAPDKNQLRLVRQLERKALRGQLNDDETSLLQDLQRQLRRPEYASQLQASAKQSAERRLTLHDLTSFPPRNARQTALLRLLENGFHVAAIGSAGTGKTFMVMQHMLYNVLDPEHPRTKLVIFRSNVEGRDLGHRPGSVDEKMAEFETPYRTVCAKLFGRETAYDKLKEQGLIEFRSTSFERGTDYEDCELLVDECQNETLHSLDTLITRPARGSRIVFAGDTIQSDLVKKSNDKTGLPVFLLILKELEDFRTIRFRPEDNVRSGISRAYLLARERMMQENPGLFAQAGMAVVAA